MSDQDQGPVLCEGGCGFYANIGLKGLCSKCFDAKLKTHAVVSSNASEGAASEPPKENDIKANTVMRCTCCRKKLGVASTYTCKCSLVFCASHRYPEEHTCTFDHKRFGRDNLKLVRVVASKVAEM